MYKPFEMDICWISPSPVLLTEKFMGIEIVPTSLLPIRPDLGEDTVRMVRHGLADILEALGEEVGPKPGEEKHVIVSIDPVHPWSQMIFVSSEYYSKIKDYHEEDRPAFEEIRNRVKKAHLENPFH